MKKITICGKEHEIDCNALTYIKHRKNFNTGIFDDIKILKIFLTNQILATEELKKENPNIDDETIIASLSRLMLNDMDLFIEAATRVAYTMVQTANKKVPEYEEWLKDIPEIKTNDEWIAEVAEFAVNCFC